MTMSNNPTHSSIRKTLSYRYAIYAVLALAYFFVFFHRTSTAVMAPDLITEFGLEPSALGLLSSMYFYAYALGQLPAGILSDRWGPRIIMFIFSLVAGTGAIIFGLAENYHVVLLGKFMVGLGVSFVWVPAMCILTNWFRKNEFATYSAILASIGNSGSIASAAPLVLLISAIGWRNSMLLVGCVSILIAALIFAIVRNKPSAIGGASIAQIEDDETPAATNTTNISVGQGLKQVFSNWNYVQICLLVFVFYGTIMGFQGLWGGPFLRDVYGLSADEAGKLLMFIPIGMIIASPLVGYTSDKIFHSRKKVLFFGAFLYSLAWFALVFMTDSMSPAFLPILMLWFGFFGSVMVISFADAKETCNPELAGTAVGGLNLFPFIGGALFQQIMGIVIAKYPQSLPGVYSVTAYRSAFTLCLAALIIGIILYSQHKENPSIGK
ncbi:MAG: MFS transporter [Bacillota bacterium]|nr:MFS transporter [Bacillota bacterium]